MNPARMTIIYVFVGLLSLIQVSLGVSTHRFEEMKSVELIQQNIFETMVKELKSAKLNVSNRIDSFVSDGIKQLGALQSSCKQPAKVRLEKIRNDYQARLSDCAIYKNIQDQLNLVKADLDLTIKTIVGSGIAGIVQLGSCIGSGQPVTCITTQWVPMMGKAMAGDIHITANTLFQIFKLIFESAEVVWTCIQGDTMERTVTAVVLEAYRCQLNGPF